MTGIAAATNLERDDHCTDICHDAFSRVLALSTGHPEKVAAAIDLLRSLTARDIAIDNMPQGICVFDAEKRLTFCNRRYAEIYHLNPEQILPGMTLSEVVARRIEAGTSHVDAEHYMVINQTANAAIRPSARIVELKDGRSVQICHQRLPDGGWVATHEDITGLRATRVIGSQEISLQTMIDWVPDYFWAKDTESRFVVVNSAFSERFGAQSTSDLVGRTDFDLHPSEMASSFRAQELEIMRSGEPLCDLEELRIDKSGVRKWLLTTKVPLRNDRNEVFGLIGISKDITDRKRADLLRDGQAHLLEMIVAGAPLEQVLEHITQLVESLSQGIFCSIMLIDYTKSYLRCAAAPNLPTAYTQLLDRVPVEEKAGSCGTAAHRREPVIVADIMYDPLWDEYRHLTLAHGLRSCWSIPIVSHQSNVLGTFALYSKAPREPTAIELDLVMTAGRLAGIAIERKLTEERIRFMAHHDELTGLPNRTLLQERLPHALLDAERLGHWVSVVFVDLDNFKVVNDSLGHKAGDKLLRTAADRMQKLVGPTDMVVRLGGDEFVIVLTQQSPDTDVVLEKVRAIRNALAETIEINGYDYRIACSIGIASYPNDGSNADTLIANADAAMYRAKESGRDGFKLYTPDLSAQVQERFLLLETLKIAVERSEFTLVYQSQVKLSTSTVFAAEALIRWCHPQFGSVPAARFIPLAEDSGLIGPIGDWVLREACRQNKVWQDAGHPKIVICVNVSARQFHENDLVACVVSALEASGLEPEYLELELTEGLIMRDVPRAIRTMEQLRSLGVRLAIDDFGTGYSSLSALKNFPVSRLKIDKSFIADLSDNESDRAVTAAIISLGQKLKLDIVAEGVETLEQLEFLRENNCDDVQGYYFGRPVSAAEFEASLD
ncbi:EAL domain-containing protein [Agrobacterium rhizogenes]|nr:EAL domain-containing protein [Rhizobium rhizogenes]NTJ80002.1 EAL domain-containing protein [Rhizobium rhizogenes]